MKPVFTAAEVASFDQSLFYATDIHGKKYIPGFVGLNNLKQNDYINAVVHALAHVKPIRDYFLLNDIERSKSELVIRFGSLLRKMYNSKSFKGHVSPHQLIQVLCLVLLKLFFIRKYLALVAKRSELESNQILFHFFRGF